MPSTDALARRAAGVLTRWLLQATPLSCVAALQPVPAFIHIRSCRFRFQDGDDGRNAALRSDAGAQLLLPAWELATDLGVETTPRGTKVEVTFPHGGVIIADYDFGPEEVMPSRILVN